MILPSPETWVLFWLHMWTAAAALLGGLVVHEAGHYLALRYFGKDPYIWYRKGEGFNVGYPKDYMGLKKDEKLQVYLTGVFTGLLFVLPAVFYVHPSWGFGILAVYLVGCRHDFKVIRGLVKW